MPDLLRFLSKYKSVDILCHPSADPDCLGSAFAVWSAMRSSGTCSPAIIVPEGMNTASSKLVEYLNLEYVTDLRPSCDLVLLVDMPSLDQLPKVKEIIADRKIPYAIVDHHTEEPASVNGAVYANIVRASSTCEIMYRSLPKKRLDRKSVQALLTGLVYDSRRFLVQPKASFSAAMNMIRRGADLGLAIEMLLNDQDISERIAKLKGAARIRLYRAKDWIFATSSIGAFEASVARSLIDLGADLALVTSEENGHSRITGRLNDRFQRSTSFNLASSVMRPLAERFSGTGGGHPSAASAKLPVQADTALVEALKLVTEKLGLEPGEISELSTHD